MRLQAKATLYASRSDGTPGDEMVADIPPETILVVPVGINGELAFLAMTEMQWVDDPV